MRLILAILIIFLGTALSKFYEKRRFDRSVYGYNREPHNDELLKKEWTFTDYETRFRAYRAKEENDCYIEKLKGNVDKQDIFINGKQQKDASKIFYTTNEPLTKFEAWQIAGGRVVNFCIGRQIILLQYTIATPGQTLDPFFNILPYDENDIVTKRVADVVLKPLISRARRQAALEQREKINENFRKTRLRRQIQQSPGKFRGQTQSQYLSINTNGQKEGRAEAEATHESSRAVVSGTQGMGQAQSMSLGSMGCEDCSKYTGEATPDRYIQHPDTGTEYGKISLERSGNRILGPSRTNLYPTTFPLLKQPGDATIHSGTAKATGDMPYPGRDLGGHMIYPTNVLATTSTGENKARYPGNIPGSIYPGSVSNIMTNDGVTHRGTAEGATSEKNEAYPVGVQQTTTAGNIPYPEGVTNPTIGGTIQYPGDLPGTITRGSMPYPSSVPDSTIKSTVSYPAGVPSSAPRGTIVYPAGVSGFAPGSNIPYPGAVPGGNIPYPRGVSGSVVDQNIPHAGGVTGPTNSGAVYPEGLATSLTGGYVSRPVNAPSTRLGSGAIYRESSGPYLGSTPDTTTGGGAVYSDNLPNIGSGIPYIANAPGRKTVGGVAGSTVSSDVSYPGSAPGTITGNGVIYPGSVPGTTFGSGISYPASTHGTATGSGVTYPRDIPGIAVEGGVTYPAGNVPTSRGTDYSRDIPGSVTGGNVPYAATLPGATIGGNPVYPTGLLGVTTAGGLVQPGQIMTESKASTDTKIYPNRHIPGIPYTGEKRYSIGRENNIEGPSGNIVRGIPTTDSRGTYTGNILSPSDHLTATAHYPAEVVQDVAVNRDPMSGPPGSILTADRPRYPEASFPDATRINTGSNILQTDAALGADRTTYPQGPTSQAELNNMHIQKFRTNQPETSYPSEHVIQYPDGSILPNSKTGRYGDTRRIIYSGYPAQKGQYPDTATWHDGRISAPDLIRGPVSREPNMQGNKQYPSDIIQQYPQLQYTPNAGTATNVDDVSQYYQQQGSFVPRENDTSNSQASSSVKQTDSGTQATASAQGKHGQGTVQSQVTGTYSGSGSFSAQAGGTDINKSVQTEISGGKEGVASNAQGVGGYGKSQAQVQLNSESGATTTGAQSSGWNHGTNSQVQASSKGGMADAQANGEGSTSSQAQIGFQPYLKTDEKLEKHVRPFRGSGTASAQSGAHTGHSQSQLEGSFQYGITYTGAAQAGSGSGAAASRKPFNFSLTDTELFKPFKPAFIPQIVHTNDSNVTSSSSDTDYIDNSNKTQQGLQTSSTSMKKVISKPMEENSQNTPSKLNRSDRLQTDDAIYDYEDEYDSEDYDNVPVQPAVSSKISKAYTAEQNDSHRQAQTIHVTTGNQYDLHVKQNTNTAQVDDILQPGDSLSGYTVPTGFRGKVTSVAGDKAIARGDGKSQSQSISLVPKEPNITYENKSPSAEIRSLKTNHERLIDHASSKIKEKEEYTQHEEQQISAEYSRPLSTASIKPSYYTITNSVAGKIDGRSSPRKYEHRYYTKSSTCGYFTFSCNVVYGSNGRIKICKPKIPTSPDGTPMKC